PLQKFRQALPFLLSGTFPPATSMDKGNILSKLLQPCLQFLCGSKTGRLFHLGLYFGQVLLHAFAPHKGIAACTAFHLCSINKDSSVVCLPHFLQLADKLVEQVFYGFSAPPGSKTGNGGVIRYLLAFQQPHKIYSVPTR